MRIKPADPKEVFLWWVWVPAFLVGDHWETLLRSDTVTLCAALAGCLIAGGLVGLLAAVIQWYRLNKHTLS
jgi:hypothetical protein